MRNLLKPTKKRKSIFTVRMCVENKDKDKYAKLTGLSPTTTNANVSQLR